MNFSTAVEAKNDCLEPSSGRRHRIYGSPFEFKENTRESGKKNDNVTFYDTSTYEHTLFIYNKSFNGRIPYSYDTFSFQVSFLNFLNHIY